MKRILKIVGAIGGIAAVVWAMRDRFVTIAAPREPEPPTFRVVTPPAPVPGTATAEVPHIDDGADAPPTTAPGPPTTTSDMDDLTRVNGIGPVFERRLQEAGFTTLADIAAATPAALADAAGVAEGRTESWPTQAASLAP